MVHILKTNIIGNPNVGLYGFCNDSFCLVGLEVNAELAKEIGETLNVPVHRISMCGTSLIGVFVAGNSDSIVIPDISFEEERIRLEELNIPFNVISTKLTALGNNILVNDNGCLVNPDFNENEIRQIQKAFAIPVETTLVADLDIVGSTAVVTKKGCVIHSDIEASEKEHIQKLLNIQCTTGTVNLGSPLIKSGVLANSNGFVVGNISGGPEIANIDEALGFLNG